MNHERHLNIYQVPVHFRVGLVGAGGIGAMAALVLSKMGIVQLTVWDDDVISETNIPTQLHSHQDVGEYKVNSLQRTLEAFSDEIFFTGIPQRIDPHQTWVSQNAFQEQHYDLFITAVDSITARHQIWQELTYYKADINWFIDARMAAEKFDMFVLKMSDQGARERYENLLFGISDSDVPDLNCTEKATFHCASAAAANIGAILRNILRNEQTSERVIQYIPQFLFYRFAL
jgi:molybdopterin/thiamine biosynthesis adenylyltransferase